MSPHDLESVGDRFRWKHVENVSITLSRTHFDDGRRLTFATSSADQSRLNLIASVVNRLHGLAERICVPCSFHWGRED